jgi:carboxymethylenebutenolidase
MCHPERDIPVSGGSGLQEREVAIALDGGSLPAFLAVPEGGADRAVMIVHDIFGANDFYHDLARRLAGAGFTALLPDLFHRQGPLAEPTYDLARARAGMLDQLRALDDIAAAAAWLRAEAGASRLGTVGFCMGGTFAMLIAARDLGFDAAVAYYGFPAGRAGWPLVPLDEAGNVRLPLLGLWGDQDHGVGMDNVARYDALLAEAGAAHEFVIYPGLPHGFLTFDQTAAHIAGALDSWERTLAFLRAELAEGGRAS